MGPVIMQISCFAALRSSAKQRNTGANISCWAGYNNAYRSAKQQLFWGPKPCLLSVLLPLEKLYLESLRLLLSLPILFYFGGSYIFIFLPIPTLGANRI